MGIKNRCDVHSEGSEVTRDMRGANWKNYCRSQSVAGTSTTRAAIKELNHIQRTLPRPARNVERYSADLPEAAWTLCLPRRDYHDAIA